MLYICMRSRGHAPKEAAFLKEMSAYNLDRKNVDRLRKSLFDQGYLDEQFIELEELEDEANPNFVEEIVSAYYDDSARLMHNIDHALERTPLEFEKLEDYMHKLKGSCSSIGAKKVKKECDMFKEFCSRQNADGCIRSFREIKEERTILKRKLEAYFQMVKQVGET